MHLGAQVIGADRASTAEAPASIVPIVLDVTDEAAVAAAYATSTATVIGLTMSVAIDYVPDSTCCNTISPGRMKTPAVPDRWAATDEVATTRASFVARLAMSRPSTSEEIAAVAVLLASNETTFTIGANLWSDGGMSL